MVREVALGGYYGFELSGNNSASQNGPPAAAAAAAMSSRSISDVIFLSNLR